MLRARVITAVVLLALLWAASSLGGPALRVVLAALVAIGLHEWLRLAGCATRMCAAAAVAFWAVLAAASMMGVHVPAGVSAAASLAGCAVWCGLGAGLILAEQSRFRVAPAASIALAVGLLSAGWLALDRLLQAGVGYLISVLAVVWVADIAAYFTGRALGRHKLAPRISPGKTWEGVAGALAAVTAAALLVHGAWPGAAVWSNRLLSELGSLAAVAALWCVVGLSIVGDLFESLLKRQAQVKDSGRLLPGHGGVLDRIDAALPTLPAAVLIDWWAR